MKSLLPMSFVHLLAGILSIYSIIAFFCSFWKSIRTHSIRLSAIMFIGALTLFSNHGWTYFASVSIIATAITETEFLQNLAAIIRGSEHYFDCKLASAEELSASQQKKTLDRHPTAVIGYNIWCACADSAGFPTRTVTAYFLSRTSLIT